MNQSIKGREVKKTNTDLPNKERNLNKPEVGENVKLQINDIGNQKMVLTTDKESLTPIKLNAQCSKEDKRGKSSQETVGSFGQPVTVTREDVERAKTCLKTKQQFHKTVPPHPLVTFCIII